jgi:hypothetical protein
MRNTTWIIAAVALMGGLLGSVRSQADEPKTKSTELKVLDRFVGTWQGTAVLTDANAKETTTEDDATMRWVLGNSYIEDKIGDTLYGLWTYDKDEELYRCWYFMPETHKPAVFTMKWNEEDTSFSGKAELGNSVMMTTSHNFIGDDKFEWSAVVKDASGKVLARHEGTKTKK